MNKNTLSFFKICHQWLGLIGGWFLFILFVTGTISIFDKEITQWMQPELAVFPVTKEISNQALDQAYNSWKQYKHIPKNVIVLPTQRDPYIRVLHFQDNILQGVVINPQKGNIIPVRSTGGGYFIDSLHNNLFIGRFIGGAIVLTISIIFIFILISGIVSYFPKIIQNAFSIYPKVTSLRFKSDLHTIISIFFLPFLFITAISGFLFLAPRYFSHINSNPSPITNQYIETSSYAYPNLLTLFNKAQLYFNGIPSNITFQKQNVKFTESEQSHIARLKNYIVFNTQTNQIISTSPPPSSLMLLNQTLLGIHTVRTGGTLLRIVFVTMGVISCVLIIYGLLLFSDKKRKTKKTIFQSYFYKIIEGINIGIIMGLPISIIVYFWLNRLLPFSLSERMFWEIKGFFITFFFILCSSISASIFNQTKLIWINLIKILAALCLFLPLIDYVQTATCLNAAIINQNYLYIFFDAIIFLCGVICIRLCFYIQNKGLS